MGQPVQGNNCCGKEREKLHDSQDEERVVLRKGSEISTRGEEGTGG